MQLGAKIISYLLHPLLMPTLLFGALLYFSPALIFPAQAWGFVSLLVFFGMTFFLPVLNLVFFKMTGTIESFTMTDRRERVMPSILITAVYGAISFMFYWKVPMPVFYKLMVIVTVLSGVVMVGNFFLKISAHAVGMCGLAGILLAMALVSPSQELILPALMAIVLSGLVMSSRLLLGVHELNEVGWGGALGVGVGFGSVVVFF